MGTVGVKTKIDQLSFLIGNLSASQKLLTQVALDFQGLALAKKRQIKDAIEQADELGEVLRVLICDLKELTCRSMELYFDQDDSKFPIKE